MKGCIGFDTNMQIKNLGNCCTFNLLQVDGKLEVEIRSKTTEGLHPSKVVPSFKIDILWALGNPFPELVPT